MKLKRGKYLNKTVKRFLHFSLYILFFSSLLLVLFFHVYRSFNIHIYNYMLIFLIAMLIILLVTTVISVLSVLIVYRRKYVNLFLVWPIKVVLKVLFPIMIYISGFTKGSRDVLRGFYIEINNIMVKSAKRKFSACEVLILLPHCLQNSDCKYKITSSIGNCKRCGDCCIGEIADMADNLSVNLLVVTGGTSARNIVSKTNPHMVVAVACERDLVAGIGDVGSLPVFGIINERPDGPCYNTNVSVRQLEDTLKNILSA